MSIQLFLNIQNSKHWDQQLNYLSQLQINEATARLLNCPKNTEIIRSLLINPRSKVITSTVEFLIELVEKYGPLMYNFSLNLMKTDILFKLLNSSNKVIFSCIHELFKAMVVHCPHSKFYNIFVSQFNSKNSQVRESISSYLLVLADTIQFPNSFVSIIKNWKNDASRIVRQNSIKLQEAVLKGKEQIEKAQKLRQSKIAAKKVEKNKQNMQIISRASTNKPKQSSKPYRQKQSQSHQNSQIIIQSFIKADQPCSLIDLETNIDFLISKIHSDQTWNMKMFAIEELCRIFNESYQEFEQGCFLKVLGVFVGLLHEKRGKVYITMCQVISNAIVYNQQLFVQFMDHNFTVFVQKLGKIQQLGPQLIILTINLNPQKYIPQLAQVALELKPLKQKILLLDILVQLICKHALPFSKCSTVIKLICKIIQKYHNNKEVYLPCMAILSHFKVQHPSQFLSFLLCLDKEVLTKVITIAETIDPHLRDSIIAYIHQLKNAEKEQKKEESFQYRNPELQVLLNQVSNQEQTSVSKLVQFVFQNQKQVSVKQFYDIIKLTQSVTSQNSLLQLELLLSEVCKTQNQKFLQALFQSIATCDTNSIQSEYVIMYLRKVNNILASFSWLMSPKYANKLILTYRMSKCPKIRLLCIKTLSLFPFQLSSPYINNKEKELIQAQQKQQSQNQSYYR